MDADSTHAPCGPAKCLCYYHRCHGEWMTKTDMISVFKLQIYLRVLGTRLKETKKQAGTQTRIYAQEKGNGMVIRCLIRRNL